MVWKSEEVLFRVHIVAPDSEFASLKLHYGELSETYSGVNKFYIYSTLIKFFLTFFLKTHIQW